MHNSIRTPLIIARPAPRCTPCVGESQNPSLVVQLEAGTYTVLVEGFESREGDFNMTIGCSLAPNAPPAPPLTPSCILSLDLMLVLDVSGSMRGQISNLKAFAHELANQFVLGENFTHVGVVEFNSDATTLTPLSGDKYDRPQYNLAQLPPLTP